MEITGTVTHQALEGGFWGVVDDAGKKWRVPDMPAAIRKNGAKVRLSAEKINEGVSIFMWGKPIRVLDYKLL
jgi:hypothetical protein